VIALAILAAVGTTLIPLLNALFAPRAPRPPAAVPQGAPVQAAQPVPAWPTYADGRTPLPVMPDGSPDWNAYYTGYPTYAAPAAAFPVVDAAPEARGVPATPPVPDPGAAPQSAPAPQAPPAPPAPPAATPDAAPHSPPMPPMPPMPPAPPGSNGSFPPPPAMPDGAQ